MLNLILSYGAAIHLGAMNGMSREIPLATGLKKMGDAARIARSALGFLLVAYPVAILLGYTALSLAPESVSRLDVILTFLLLGSQELYGYAFTSLRAALQFSLASRFQAIRALIIPLFCLPFTLYGGLSGFIGGLILVNVLSCVLAARFARVSYQPLWDWPTIIHLIKVGFPIMIIGLVLSLMATVDRWIIMAFMDEVALGHYSLSILALGALGLLPKVLAQQLYPRMAQNWAQFQSMPNLFQLANRQRRLTLAVILPISIVGLLTAPVLVTYLLPEYKPGTRALQLSLFVPIMQSLGQGYGNIFNVIGQQGKYLQMTFFAVSVNLVTSVLFVRHFGLVGVAFGTLVGFTTLSALVLAYGYKLRRRGSDPAA